jgi:spermidine synthase
VTAPDDADGGSADEGYVVVARARSPRGDLTLARRGPRRWELRVNGVYVMDTENTGTEEALAELALAAVGSPRRVLVGGLGLGFTTRALLRDGRLEQLVVAELEPALVSWLHDGTFSTAGVVADPRLRLVVGDVRDVVRDQAPGTVDAIVLDVDNGPAHLVHMANAEVYGRAFLATCANRLRDGGVVAVWSSTRSPELEETLVETVGRCVPRALPVRLGARVDEYIVYLATRRPGRPGEQLASAV